MATAGRRALPDFVIIGAARCGTTSMFDYLRQHPLVLPSSTKEVHYADREANVSRGERWYRTWFPPVAELERVGRLHGVERAVTGEATPNYFCHPDAAARLRAAVPGARLILLLREPGDRAWSQYRWSMRWGGEPLDFREALVAEPERLPDRFAMMRRREDRQTFVSHSYATRGLYAEQLEWWFDAYPREQILLLRSEDLFGDPSGTLGRVRRFLDLPLVGDTAFRVLNEGTGPRRLDPEMRAWLDDYYAEPNRRLAELTDGAITWP
jgi:hypothetical protein